MRTLKVFLVIVLIAAASPAWPQATAEQAGGWTAAEQANVEATQALFAAFLAGDIDGFLTGLADDVVWEINGSPDFVPNHGVWEGVDAVREWIGLLEADVEFVEFTPERYWADGDTVIVVCHEVGVVRATGKQIDQREVMLFTYADGKVASFMGFDDSAQEQWAMTPDE